MKKEPKAELPGIGKATGQQRSKKLLHVWPRKRGEIEGGAPIFYFTATLPGKGPVRRSTHKRIRSSAEEYAAIEAARLLNPKAVTSVRHDEQLDLTLPPSMETGNERSTVNGHESSVKA